MQAAAATRWVLHAEGGGWCYNEDQCTARSKMHLGSSSTWGSTTKCYGNCDGILSSNASKPHITTSQLLAPFCTHYNIAQ